LINLAWALGVRGLADKIRQWWLEPKNYRESLRFKRMKPDFAIPPARLVFDANHYLAWGAYYDSGRDAARGIAGFICQAVGEVEEKL
jgi:hypothetical protein